MPSQSIPTEESVNNIPLRKKSSPVAIFLTWVVSFVGIGVMSTVFLLPESPYALTRYFWYADFRYWPGWISWCCWIVLVLGIISALLAVFVPKNEARSVMLRREAYQKGISILLVFSLWAVWCSSATLTLATLFTPILSPFRNYLYGHYTLPLADYYTTGEGSSPSFWPVTCLVLAILLFVAWRTWFHVNHWRRLKATTVTLMLLGLLPIMLGADEPTTPKKVETSTGIYDVQSKDDLTNFTAEEIRELVRIEDDRIRGAGKPPHPILVYCFEERSFQYTGGKYENAEIKYRLRVPQKIVPGKKYPLVVHLHGVGEAGKDNMLSLAHLHSILPLMLGSEQQDFYLLVLQCPPDNRIWTFKPEKDGNLDVVIAATDHVIQNNPIDKNRLSAFGLSSGGYGVWQWVMKEPDKFAAAIPASSGAPNDIQKLTALSKTAIWTFRNKGDGNAPLASIREAMRVINGSGGYMKLTQFDQGGHAAWRSAMDEYNCFSWMIAQKRGGWFNPPPERKVYTYRSMSNCFFAFFLPLGLAAGLLIFQRSPYCERLHEKIADKLYRRRDEDDWEGEDDEEYEDDDQVENDEASTNGFHILSDVTGTKKIKAKVVGFQGNAVKIQSLEGKVALTPIKQFSEADQELMRKMQAEQPLPEGFRRWTNFNGKQTFSAKFVGFQSDDRVLLQSLTGKIMPVPVNQLGKQEQDFLASQREQASTKPLPDGFREWTDVSGTKKIVAKLLGFQDDKARFELQNGQVIVTPIHQFAAEDQVLLTQRMNEETPPT